MEEKTCNSKKLHRLRIFSRLNILRVNSKYYKIFALVAKRTSKGKENWKTKYTHSHFQNEFKSHE